MIEFAIHHHINHIKQTTPKQEECIKDGNANIDRSKWQTNKHTAEFSDTIHVNTIDGPETGHYEVICQIPYVGQGKKSNYNLSINIKHKKVLRNLQIEIESTSFTCLGYKYIYILLPRWPYFVSKIQPFSYLI